MPLNAEEREATRIKGLANRAWSAWETHFDDICRIGKHGPNGTKEDLQIIQGVFRMVEGDMCVKQHERNLLESGEP